MPDFSKQFILRWITVIILLFSFTDTACAQLIFNTILHDAQVTQRTDELAYDVNLFVSVLDDGSIPIKNLQPDNFTILQDSQPVSFTLSEAPSQATSLVLVIDTSGSMAGQGIQNAREAVQLFLQQLDAEDSVAIISFNSKVTTVSDFSQDRTSLQRQVEMVEAVPNAGTCLYDALFQAVQMSSLAPQGRRAILAMTDGKDELPDGRICSSAKIDDVIQAAANNIDTPIYSIGVGKTLDENGLQRLALLTGGSFQKSSDFSQLGTMFENMQVQLKNQYLLSFVSNAPPGDHSITVKTVIGSNSDIDTREIRLPDPGPMIKIVSPNNGDPLTADTPLRVEFLGKTDNVASVRYEIGGAVIGETLNQPYEVLPDAALIPSQGAKLTASALDTDGEVLSSYTIDFVIPEVTAIEPTAGSNAGQVEPTLEGAETDSEKEEDSNSSSSPNLIVIGIVVTAFILLIALVLLVLKPFNRSKLAVNPSFGPEASAVDTTSESTFDSVMPLVGIRGQSSGGGALTVVFSDDRTRIGEKIIIQQAVTHIGRSSNNEIVFPKDHPVSRFHAVIEYKNGRFQLSEALTGDESGMKAPTFGTFVNDENLGGSPAILRSGDEIRLGNRLKLRFDAFDQPMMGDNPSATLDQ